MSTTSTEPSAPRHALCFDGGDDFLSLPPIDLDWSGGLTVEVWARFDRLNYYSRIIDFGAGQSDNIVLCNIHKTDALGLYVFSASGPTRTSDGS